MKPSEAVTALQGSLEAIKEHLPALEAVNAELEAAKAELDATTAKLDDIKAELAKANAGMTTAQALAQQEHDKQIYTKQQELKALSDRVVEANAKLADLNVQASAKQSLHDQIEASLASLKAKFV